MRASFALLFLVVACERGSDDPPPQPSEEEALASVQATPKEQKQGVGGSAVIAITVEGGRSSGLGRPLPLRIVVEDKTILEEAGPNSIRMTTPGELTFTPGPPPTFNSFLSNGTKSAFDLRLKCLSLGKSQIDIEDGNNAKGRATVNVECTNDPPTISEHPPREFANGIGEMSTVNRAGGAFTRTTGGVASNFGERTSAMRALYTDIGQNCEKYEGITDFVSVKGPDSLTATAGAQTGTTTYDAGTQKYVWSGLVPGPVFGGSPRVDFTFGGKNAAVDAPADFVSIDDALSAPAGLDTKFSVSDTESDLFVSVFGALTNNGGFSCLYPAASLPLENGRRATPVVPQEVRNVIPDVGTRLNTLFLGKLRQVDVVDLYPGAGTRSLQAGRLLKVSRPYLDP